MGNSVTAVYLTDGTGPYYFLNSSSSAKFWTSQLEMAQSTGQKAKIKYEQTNSNPGANCGFNPGNVIYAISVGP